MTDIAAYGGLFLAAFVAATILPAQSEAILAGLILSKSYSLWGLLAVASVGNILGSCLNWGLGRGIETTRGHRWFPASEAMLARAQGWYSRWGHWSLLLSWVPVIGDPLTVVAGVMRESFLRFLALVSVAKIGRYLILAAVVDNL